MPFFSIPKSQQVFIYPPIYKKPIVRIFSKMNFQSRSKCENLDDILIHLKSAIEYRDFYILLVKQILLFIGLKYN